MAWYVSYRTGRSIVMHIFKGKELAMDAACGLLNRGYSDALEVGPMLGSRRKRTQRAGYQADLDDTPGASTLNRPPGPFRGEA